MPSANEIRQQFIDFFVEKHGHSYVPSSPVVPLDDPTLLFANAGMNQFKDVFLGTGTRNYKRAVNTQKCIRAGGKHNDLDDVGQDTYHHTFFEMLGNWSFGDYFKREAIEWAWDLLTNVWGLDKRRLHATVFQGDPDSGVEADDEAAELWRTVTDIDPSHIHRFDKKDNFWEMGDTGPCGPCSEIHYDSTPDFSGGPLVNAGTESVIEIWNLVFIQFNRNADKSLTPLPAKHVDTGMGFERIVKVLQGKQSNYDTDVFAPIFASIQQATGATAYAGKLDDLKDTAYRVIGDHIRTLTFALTDGARIGNNEREYVLKRILRRAERYGRQYLKTTKPFLCDLVPAVVEAMSGVFPELRRKPDDVANQIREEEEVFIRTLDRGIGLFEKVSEKTKQEGVDIISGKDAFELHSTYGVFIDITEQMAREVGLSVDREGFEAEMEKFREQSGKGGKQISATAIKGDLPPTDDSPKYKKLEIKAKVIGWVKENLVGNSGEFFPGNKIALLLDKTNFYAEQGGQVGDTGVLKSRTGTFHVEDTQKLGASVLHIGKVYEGKIKVGQRVTVTVSSDRADTMRNHTATHLMNWALREVLGDHIEQKGSLVDHEKTRFDFTYDAALTSDQINKIERLVNDKIVSDWPVHPVEIPLETATNLPGVRAVFGEKYPDPVRVVLIGAKKPEDVTRENPVEFCGGTHLSRTGEAGFFKIVGQDMIGRGVRRVTAVTGTGALKTVQDMAGVLEQLTDRLKCRVDEAPQRVERLQNELKEMEKRLKKGAATDLQGVADKLFADAAQVNGSRIIVGEIPPGPTEQVRNQVDRLKQKAGSAVVVVGWSDEGKVQLIAAATDDLVKKGMHAGNLVREVAKLVGGGGGGKPTMAQAGGSEPEKLADALRKASELVNGQLAAS